MRNMKTTVTITSKRQITIPRKLWDSLQLDGVRRLDAEIKDGTLVLARDDYYDNLRTLWEENAASICGEITDESIRTARRTAARSKQL